MPIWGAWAQPVQAGQEVTEEVTEGVTEEVTSEVIRFTLISQYDIKLNEQENQPASN